MPWAVDGARTGEPGWVAADRVGHEDSGANKAHADQTDQNWGPPTAPARRSPTAYAAMRSPVTQNVAIWTQPAEPRLSELTGCRSAS